MNICFQLKRDMKGDEWPNNHIVVDCTGANKKAFYEIYDMVVNTVRKVKNDIGNEAFFTANVYIAVDTTVMQYNLVAYGLIRMFARLGNKVGVELWDSAKMQFLDTSFFDAEALDIQYSMHKQQGE